MQSGLALVELKLSNQISDLPPIENSVPEIHYLRAIILRTQGKHSEAIAHFEQIGAGNQYPKLARHYYQWGLTHCDLRDYASALRIFDIKNNNTDPHYQYQYAFARLKYGLLGYDAAYKLVHVIDLNQHQPDFKLFLAALEQLRNCNQQLASPREPYPAQLMVVFDAYIDSYMCGDQELFQLRYKMLLQLITLKAEPIYGDLADQIIAAYYWAQVKKCCEAVGGLEQFENQFRIEAMFRNHWNHIKNQPDNISILPSMINRITAQLDVNLNSQVISDLNRIKKEIDPLFVQVINGEGMLFDLQLLANYIEGIEYFYENNYTDAIKCFKLAMIRLQIFQQRSQSPNDLLLAQIRTCLEACRIWVGDCIIGQAKVLLNLAQAAFQSGNYKEAIDKCHDIITKLLRLVDTFKPKSDDANDVVSIELAIQEDIARALVTSYALCARSYAVQGLYEKANQNFREAKNQAAVLDVYFRIEIELEWLDFCLQQQHYQGLHMLCNSLIEYTETMALGEMTNRVLFHAYYGMARYFFEEDENSTAVILALSTHVIPSQYKKDVTDSKLLDAYRMLYLAYSRNQMFKDADHLAPKWEEWLSSPASHAIYNKTLGDCYYKRGHYHTSIGFYQRLSEADVETYKNLAYAYAHATVKNTEKAIEYFEKASDLMADAYEWRSFFKNFCGQFQENISERIKDKHLEFSVREKLQKLIAHVESILRANQTSAPEYILLLRRAAYTETKDKAYRMLTGELAQLLPQWFAPALEVADFVVNRQANQDVTQSTAPLIDLNSSVPFEACYLHAMAWRERKQYCNAIACFEKADTLVGVKCADYYYQWALTHYDLLQYEQALQVFKKANATGVKAAQAGPHYTYLYGLVLMKQGLYETAATQFAAAIEKSSSYQHSIKARMQLAHCHWRITHASGVITGEIVTPDRKKVEQTITAAYWVRVAEWLGNEGQTSIVEAKDFQLEFELDPKFYILPKSLIQLQKMIDYIRDKLPRRSGIFLNSTWCDALEVMKQDVACELKQLELANVLEIRSLIIEDILWELQRFQDLGYSEHSLALAFAQEGATKFAALAGMSARMIEAMQTDPSALSKHLVCAIKERLGRSTLDWRSLLSLCRLLRIGCECDLSVYYDVFFKVCGCYADLAANDPAREANKVSIQHELGNIYCEVRSVDSAVNHKKVAMELLVALYWTDIQQAQGQSVSKDKPISFEDLEKRIQGLIRQNVKSSIFSRSTDKWQDLLELMRCDIADLRRGYGCPISWLEHVQLFLQHCDLAEFNAEFLFSFSEAITRAPRELVHKTTGFDASVTALTAQGGSGMYAITTTSTTQPTGVKHLLTIKGQAYT